MADAENATKAPESDLHSSPPAPTESTASPIPGDSIAQTGPAMGEHCTTDRPLPSSSAAPKGDISKLNDISCYITKPSSYPQEPCKLLLLLTGGTGLRSTNNQLQADAFAERGFVVVMPDQFSNDPAPNAASTTTATATDDQEQASSPTSTSQPSLLERLKMGAAETAKSFFIDMWLARHTPEKVLPLLQKTLEGAREEFADAVANGGGVYGAGYCFGAKYILLLLGEHSASVKWGQKTAGEDEEKGEARKDPELKAGAIAHGTDITKADMEGIKAPVAMACVENDSLFPDAVREQGRASLELNAIEHSIKVFDGVPHGFAVAGDYNDSLIQEKQKEAFELMSSFLEAH